MVLVYGDKVLFCSMLLEGCFRWCLLPAFRALRSPGCLWVSLLAGSAGHQVPGGPILPPCLSLCRPRPPLPWAEGPGGLEGTGAWPGVGSLHCSRSCWGLSFRKCQWHIGVDRGALAFLPGSWGRPAPPSGCAVLCSARGGACLRQALQSALHGAQGHGVPRTSENPPVSPFQLLLT